MSGVCFYGRKWMAVTFGSVWRQNRTFWMHFRIFVFPSKFRNKYDFFRNGWQLCKMMDQIDESDSEQELKTVIELVDDIKSVTAAPSRSLHASMLVEGQRIRFQLDSGASYNVLPRQTIALDDNRWKPTSHVLSMTIRPLSNQQADVP